MSATELLAKLTRLGVHLEARAGKPVFNALTRIGSEHPLEETGAKLRALMPWLGQNKLVDRERN